MNERDVMPRNQNKNRAHQPQNKPLEALQNRDAIQFNNLQFYLPNNLSPKMNTMFFTLRSPKNSIKTSSPTSSLSISKQFSSCSSSKPCLHHSFKPFTLPFWSLSPSPSLHPMQHITNPPISIQQC